MKYWLVTKDGHYIDNKTKNKVYIFQNSPAYIFDNAEFAQKFYDKYLFNEQKSKSQKAIFTYHSPVEITEEQKNQALSNNKYCKLYESRGIDHLVNQQA